MDQSNEYYRDTNDIYRRSTLDEYRCRRYSGERSTSRCRDNMYLRDTRSRSRSRHRSRSGERYYTYERRCVQQTRYRRHSSSSRERSETRRRSKRKHKKRRSRSHKRSHKRKRRSRSASNVEPKSNALISLREEIAWAVTSAIKKIQTDSTVNSTSVHQAEWQDSWDIEVEPLNNSPSSQSVQEISSDDDEMTNNFKENNESEALTSPREPSTGAGHSIDNEILQKLISQRDIETVTADPLVSNLQFDFDLVKRAVSTAKMLESEDVVSNVEQEVHYFQHDGLSQQHCSYSGPQFESNFQLNFPSLSQMPMAMASTSNTTAMRRRNPFATSPIRLPIPSTEILLKQIHATAHQHDNQMVNAESAAVVPQRHEPKTYGEYKKMKAFKALETNFKIPRKEFSNSNRMSENLYFNDFNKMERNQELTITSSRPSESVEATNHFDDDRANYIRPSTSPQVTELTAQTIDPDECLVDSSEVENVNDPPKCLSAQEKAIATLKDFISTNQFVSFVELMTKITKDDTISKLNAAFHNNEKSDRDAIDKSTTNVSKQSIVRKEPSTVMENRGSGCPAKILRNDNVEWHSLKKMNCQLCNKPPGNSLVSHYVNDHPDHEVLVSRLAPEAADSLRSRKKIAKCKMVRKKGSLGVEYKQFCYFCNIYQCMPRCFWITHMARHTGYYPVKCNHCSRMFAQKPEVNSTTCGRINNFSKILQPQFKEREIKAYVCDICNFVRFHQKDIEMHLNNEHDDDGDWKTFKKVNFLSFPCKNKKGKRKCYANTESDYESDQNLKMEINRYAGSDKNFSNQSNATVQSSGDAELWESDSNMDIETGSDANGANKSSGEVTSEAVVPLDEDDDMSNWIPITTMDNTEDTIKEEESPDNYANDPDYVP